MNDAAQSDRTGSVELGPLRENLPFLTRAIRAYIRGENTEFYAEFQAEQGEIAILCLIGLNPSISQNDLAATLVFKKSAITKLVKELEARGVIRRSKNDHDKRFNTLELTEEGQARYERFRERVALQHEAFLEPFSQKEREEFFSYLNRLHAHLEERHALRTGIPTSISGSSDD